MSNRRPAWCWRGSDLACCEKLVHGRGRLGCTGGMTVTPVILRTAGPADLAAVLPLAVAFYAEDGFDTGEHALRSNLSVLLASPAARVTVVQSATQLLGFAVTTTSFGLENGLIAELEDLFVVPMARRRGLGDRLIADSVLTSTRADVRVY